MERQYKFSINRNKGILIVCEGISGSGKSCGVMDLSDYFIKEGCNVVVTEWNSNRVIRGIVSWLNERKLLSAHLYSFLQWLSFFNDYYTEILPSLNKGCLVIADRYVYTAMTRDVANGASKSCRYRLHNFFRRPDILLFYDASPDVCHERIQRRGKELFHTNKRILNHPGLKNKQLYYLKKLRSEYMRLLKRLGERGETNIVLIDENSSNIHLQVEHYIDKKEGEVKCLL